MGKVELKRVTMLRTCVINGGETGRAGETYPVSRQDAEYLVATGKAEYATKKGLLARLKGEGKDAAPAPPERVDELGLKDTVAAILEEADITTVAQVLELGKGGLVELEGIGEATAKKILAACEG